ncbi:MAG: hypothetical protein IPH53_14025 [Flavobacteriales bacterium]|nr:hypothetical protein [Flavobacteriales bacterium]MBK7752770.1 hypothetical protein [Flavobacteriales bacterium]
MARSPSFHQTSSTDHGPTWFWVLITIILFFIITWGVVGDYNKVIDDTPEGTTQDPPQPGPVPIDR